MDKPATSEEQLTIGQKILKLRETKNLTQDDLACELNVSRQLISKWESNDSMPGLGIIAKLCQISEKNPEYFLTDETKNEILEISALMNESTGNSKNELHHEPTEKAIADASTEAADTVKSEIMDYIAKRDRKRAIIRSLWLGGITLLFLTIIVIVCCFIFAGSHVDDNVIYSAHYFICDTDQLLILILVGLLISVAAMIAYMIYLSIKYIRKKDRK